MENDHGFEEQENTQEKKKAEEEFEDKIFLKRKGTLKTQAGFNSVTETSLDRAMISEEVHGYHVITRQNLSIQLEVRLTTVMAQSFTDNCRQKNSQKCDKTIESDEIKTILFHTKTHHSRKMATTGNRQQMCLNQVHFAHSVVYNGSEKRQH